MSELTHESLRQLLRYDPSTGVFHWRSRRNQFVPAGSIAGSDNGNGHLQIHIGKKQYMAHRLAWLYVHGAMPNGDIDHINGVRADNRLANLRVVSRRVNTQNQRAARADNEVGLLGVGRMGDRFRARINVNGKVKALGCFDTPELAHAAYISAKRELHEGCTL